MATCVLGSSFIAMPWFSGATSVGGTSMEGVCPPTRKRASAAVLHEGSSPSGRSSPCE